MALTMTGSITLPAKAETVWEMLNDPEILGRCIPGCEEIERIEDDTGFRATARVVVGPIKARFKGKVSLSDIEPLKSYTLTGEGEGGAAGFVKGNARVRLEEIEAGTRLDYDVEAAIGGKLAQLGGRMINGIAKRQADDFFAKFEQIVNSDDQA